MTAADAAPIFVEAWRGPILENRHRGRLALMSAGGALQIGLGDVWAPMLPRSAYKALQALPLIESGGAERFRLAPEDLALACASHSGAPAHTERVGRWLDALELPPDALQCGAHAPLDAPARAALRAAGETPSTLHHQCSGKHAGFLTLARMSGADPAAYLALDAAPQRQVAEALSDMAEWDLSPGPAIDGCSAPNHPMPLGGLALALARLGRPEGLPPARQAAAARLRDAMAAHPFFVSGDGRDCAELSRASNGAAICKTGADGVFTAILPRRGLGLALKIEDGAGPAAACAMAAALVALGVADPADPLVRKRLISERRNFAGALVGRLEAAASFANALRM